MDGIIREILGEVLLIVAAGRFSRVFDDGRVAHETQLIMQSLAGEKTVEIFKSRKNCTNHRGNESYPYGNRTAR